MGRTILLRYRRHIHNRRGCRAQGDPAEAGTYDRRLIVFAHHPKHDKHGE